MGKIRERLGEAHMGAAGVAYAGLFRTQVITYLMSHQLLTYFPLIFFPNTYE